MRWDYPLSVFPYGFWDNPLWKEAARAGLRQISKMVGQGNLSGASRLATTPGVLKPSAAGSQLQQLGRGSEGMATMVAHPEHGVAVRKLYDPKGISTPEMIQRKEQAGRALGDNPNFSKFLGSAPTPHGGGTMHFSEYVPQASGAAAPSSIGQATRQAKQSLQGVGFEGHDIRGGNMIQDARTGQHKAIDYIPAKPGEMESNAATPNQISVSPQGSQLFNNPGNQTTNKGLLGGMLGGNKPMGVRRNVNVSSTRTQVAQGTPSPLANRGAGAGATTPLDGPTPAVGGTPSAATTPLKPHPPTTMPMKPQLTTPPSTAVLKPPKPVSGLAPAQT